MRHWGYNPTCRDCNLVYNWCPQHLRIRLRHPGASRVESVSACSSNVSRQGLVYLSCMDTAYVKESLTKQPLEVTVPSFSFFEELVVTS